MKNIIENIALILVGLLSMIIIVFIVLYTLIEDENNDMSMIPSKDTISNVVKTKSYLDALEGYGDDTDVEVDATQESTRNSISIQSELTEDALDRAIDDKSKSSYIENLDTYSGVKKELKFQKGSSNITGEPEKLAQEEIVDEIGMAIDALDL